MNMAASEWYHQKMAIVGTIDPTASTTAGTFWTDAVDMHYFERAIFIVQTNTVAANTTLTLTVYGDGATATGGMTAAIATSSALTNANDDSQIWVEIDTEDMNPDGRDRYCRGKLVIAGTGGTVDHLSAVVLGANCRYHPASAYDLATVAQITTS
jgi:hypothetical protein